MSMSARCSAALAPLLVAAVLPAAHAESVFTVDRAVLTANINGFLADGTLSPTGVELETTDATGRLESQAFFDAFGPDLTNSDAPVTSGEAIVGLFSNNERISSTITTINSVPRTPGDPAVTTTEPTSTLETFFTVNETATFEATLNFGDFTDENDPLAGGVGGINGSTAERSALTLFDDAGNTLGTRTLVQTPNDPVTGPGSLTGIGIEPIPGFDTAFRTQTLTLTLDPGAYRLLYSSTAVPLNDGQQTFISRDFTSRFTAVAPTVPTNPNPAPVPSPSSAALGGLLLTLGLTRRRR